MNKDKVEIKWNIEQNYNDTVSSKVASMCLRAYGIYDKEIQNPWLSQRNAIARAIGDAIKESISIVQISASIDRVIPDEVAEDTDFIKYEMRQAFMMMADEIYNSEHWRVVKSGFPVGQEFRFTIGILKLDNK